VGGGSEDLSITRDQEVDGSWKLVMRKLPDGATVTPPAVLGAYTIDHGLQNLNVFWHTPEGCRRVQEPSRIATFGQYMNSPSGYAISSRRRARTALGRYVARNLF
jgi:hypothetical protein